MVKLQKSVALPIEPIDKCWGVGVSGLTDQPSPFPRINAILAITDRTTNGECVPERAVLVTESLKKTEGQPHIIRTAKALAEHFHRTPIFIFDHELIVGSLGCKKKAGPVFPEFGLNWVVEEMENGLLGYSEKRTHDYFTHTDETYQQLKALQDYWKGKSVEDVAVPLMTEEMKKGSHMEKMVFSCASYVFCGAGHTSINYETLFKKGYKGIRQDILDKVKLLDPTDPADIKRKTFYEAALIANEAATDYIKRHAKLAEEMAGTEKDVARAKELRMIAKNCEWISENPPRTFWEAIQLVHLATAMVLMECNGHSISYGRFDQYMYSYYKSDIETGTMTREQMQELIENFQIKIWEMNKLRDHVGVQIFGNGGIGGPCLTLGGIKRDGTDGTNDVTYMMLDAIAHTRIPDPWTAVRMHKGTPLPLKIKVANVIRLGTGEPKFFNDEVTIEAMIKNGRSVADSRNYQVVGCVEPDATGKEYGWHDAADMNINKVLELAINDGRCMEDGPDAPRTGLATGSLADFKTFDEVLDAFDNQMEYMCKQMVSMLNCIDIAHQIVKPLPYLSTIMEGCIDKGLDATAGGALYNFIGPQGVGIGSAADGLSTIKQLVFDEKKVSGATLLDAVRNNWKGHEPLYAYVNSDHVHHYGNDDDYADEMAKYAFNCYCRHVQGKPTAHGGHFQPGMYSVTINTFMGEHQYASVEGREAWEPVSDCMGAVHTHRASHDVKGPSAICKSVTKMNHGLAGNGTLLNWKFSPSALEGDAGRDNFIALMDTYIKRKGMHSQFNVVARETLLKAQANPDEYRNLLVRVAGYSAYFVELGKNLQDDIIGRTELSFT
jgi:pyruvate formate-lyase/glycerol dehydratase family glycyl radical enzyme